MRLYECICVWGTANNPACAMHDAVARRQTDERGEFSPDDNGGILNAEPITLSAPRVVELWRSLGRTPGGPPVPVAHASDLTAGDVSRIVWAHIGREFELHARITELEAELTEYRRAVAGVRFLIEKATD